MSEPARNRFALDLDDLERQLRGAAQPQKPGSAVDPLQELTRLVGQDDPLKDLFAGRSAAPARPAVAEIRRRPPAPRPAPRIEPAFQPTLVTQAPATPPAELRGALDEFEALLRRTEPVKPAAETAAEAGHAEPDAVPAQAQPYAMQAETGPHAYVPEPPRDLDEAAAQGYPVGYDRPLPDDYAEPALAEEDGRHYDPPRSRKGLWTAASLLVVAGVAIAVAMVFRNTQPAGSNGQPPVISADSGPTKVAPANPGGAEIPNQNKQIYERAGDNPAGNSADKTKIVNREEQPVDVQQATRSLPPRIASVTSGAAAAIEPTATANANALAPAEPGLVPIPAVPGLGEPRRVRTVAIRPDGTPASVNGASAAASTQGLVTGSAPAARPAATNSPAAIPSIATLPPVRPQPAAPAAAPATESPKVQDRAAAPTTPPASSTPPARTRTAALGQAPATSPAPAAAPRTDANGGFAVQLAAPGSEAEARATFSALQRKYPDQLGGQSPIVRRTELAGGKTVYRLRVGPYSRDGAASMCSALQAAGGQCFIAKN